jgi:ATP-binding cassette, subfamily B, bacterial PglK
MLDLAGLGLIAPYIALVVNPESVIQGNIGQFLERVGISTEPKDLLILMGLGIISIFLFKAIAGIFVNRTILHFSWNQQTKLRTNLMRSYQKMPYTDYLLRNSSEYIQTIHSMAGQFIADVIQPILRIISEGIVVLVVLSLLGYTNALALALLLLMLGGSMSTYYLLFRNKIKEYGKSANIGATLLLQGVNEGMAGFKEIRILDKSLFFIKMVNKGAKINAQNQVRSQVLSTAPRYLLEFIVIAFVVLFIFGTLMLGGKIENMIPTLGLFGVAALRLTPSVNQLINGFIRIRHGRYAISRLYADLKYMGNHMSKEPIGFKIEEKTGPFRKMLINDISFSYSNTKDCAIKNLTISIKAGDSIGLIGSSGAGKTTLLDVLLGLLEPQKGNIIYNGHSLQNSLSAWRSQVAYLPQDAFLIDNTLRCNVAFGLEEEEIDEINFQKALKQARLAELVEQLPKGVETLLGEHGVRLSGGQRQRVALARAFYHGRNVLIMDEATSSLDNETEKEIVEEIKHLKGNKTLIVIAHRLTTVQHCDQIYLLKNGRIVESGSFNQVVKKKMLEV